MSNIREEAKNLFLDGYNCSQAVIGALAPYLDFDPKTAMRLSEGFGGGMGRLRLTCGAVSGMVMAAGLKKSTGENDREKRGELYKLVQIMAKDFKKMNGSIICSELLSGVKTETNTSMPDERTKEYYQKRPCAECVADAAEIAYKYLIEKEL